MPAPIVPNPQILKSVPLLSTFTDQQIAMLGTCIQHRSYPRGSSILRAGEETEALYIILSGRVKVLIPDEQGREVILTMLGPRDFVGEMGLFVEAQKREVEAAQEEDGEDTPEWEMEEEEVRLGAQAGRACCAAAAAALIYLRSCCSGTEELWRHRCSESLLGAAAALP